MSFKRSPPWNNGLEGVTRTNECSDSFFPLCEISLHSLTYTPFAELSQLKRARASCHVMVGPADMTTEHDMAWPSNHSWRLYTPRIRGRLRGSDGVA